MVSVAEEIYSEPKDLAKFFESNLRDGWFVRLIDEAEKFYDENGVSPIVEQQKFDGYMIDYFFLVETTIKYFCEMIEDKDIAEKVGLMIKRDFVDDEKNRTKNGKFLIAMLRMLGYLVLNKSSFLYVQLCYFAKEKDRAMIFDAIVLDTKNIKENFGSKIKTLEKIGGKEKYSLFGLGLKKTNEFFRECLEKKLELISFKN